MKTIQIIILTLTILIISGCSSKNQVEKTDINTTTENNVSVNQDSNTTLNDINKTVEPKIQQKQKVYTLFEKTFVNHIAYNHYENAIKLMYQKKHKEAYAEAMKAKDVYDNIAKKEQTINLPYIPGYIRESAQTPRRTYYKIVKQKTYELKRLIRKIKLLDPPIPFVVLNQTSTYIDVTVTNFGDTPLDNLVVEINFEKAAVFDKINPKESKTVRFDKSMNIEQISFTEEYGFAPAQIDLTQE